jgi:hypothetical protein
MGEGGWFRDEALGQWRPYNDYDICLVVQTRYAVSEMQSCERTLQNELSLEWVDLCQLEIDELPKLKLTIRNYDLKQGSLLVAGDKSVYDVFPSYSAASITLKDAQILFYTRLYTLVGSFPEGGLVAVCSPEEVRFFRYQLAKAVLAVVDVKLLELGKYHSSYRRRASLVQEHFPKNTGLMDLVEWAIAEKLRPRAEMMSTAEIEELYENVSSLFMKEMLRAMSLYYEVGIRNVRELHRVLFWHPRGLVRRVASLFRQRSLIYDKQLMVFLAQAHVVAAWSAHEIDSIELAHASRCLGKISTKYSGESTWNGVRNMAAKARMDIC